MKKYRNKVFSVLLAGMAMLLMTGFSVGKSNVELRNEGPLIDLGVFVKDSPIGKDGGSPSELEGAAGSSGEETQEAEDTGKGQTQTSGEKTAVSGITVEIIHDIITVNGQRCADVSEAMEKVKESWRVGMNVYLIDAYAEYTAYTQMYQSLRSCSMQVVEKQK